MFSVSAPLRPFGVPQLHRSRLIRLEPDNEAFSVVVGRDGVPVPVATTYLLSRRHVAASRHHKEAWVVAVVLDVLAARKIDPAAVMQTSDALAPHHVQDIADALRFVGCRTAQIRRSKTRAGEGSRLHVGNAEWMNRLQIAARFLDSWMRNALHLLRRDAVLHRHMRELIREIEENFRARKFTVATIPREGLEPAELKFFDKIVHFANPKNPWRDDRFMMFLIAALFRLLGNRARELLLYQVTDVVMREGRPALRLLHADMRHDTTGMPTGLKRAPRHIRIPDWMAALLTRWIETERPKIGQRLAEAGNRIAAENFRKCPYIFVSSRGRRLSSTCLYDRFRTLREAFPDQLPADLSPARLRNSRADEIVAASREDGLDLSRVTEGLFGWAVGSTMLGRYANAEAERQAGEFARSRSDLFEESLP